LTTVCTARRAKGEEVPIPTAPANVEVAVVEEMSDPTVTWEEVAATRVPSNQRSAEERADALVPPFAIGRIPLMSVVSEMRAVDTAPAVALRNPEMELMVSPPLVMLRPPAMVLVAVPVALMYPTWSPRVWMPPAKVEVAVVVAKSEPTYKGWVEVGAMVEALVHAARVLLTPLERVPESVPQTRYPWALVSMVSQPVKKVFTEELMDTPPEKVELAVVLVASMVPVNSRRDWMPPVKVEVAEVVAMTEPTYRGDVEVAAMRVPSKLSLIHI
jgi:hypothetical protein